MDRTQLLERILDIYTSSYDITRCPETELPMTATAAYHEHGVGYMLVQSAQMWTADRHEYTYFFSVPNLTKEIWETCLAKVLELGEPLVKPEKGHMNTNLVCMVLCDSADEDALLAVRKYHRRKSFQFSLKGWMEVHAVVAEVGKASATANAAGRNEAEFWKNIFCPRQKKRFLKWK